MRCQLGMCKLRINERRDHSQAPPGGVGLLGDSVGRDVVRRVRSVRVPAEDTAARRAQSQDERTLRKCQLIPLHKAGWTTYHACKSHPEGIADMACEPAVRVVGDPVARNEHDRKVKPERDEARERRQEQCQEGDLCCVSPLSLWSKGNSQSAWGGRNRTKRRGRR